jgi:hypothetical protein
VPVRSIALFKGIVASADIVRGGTNQHRGMNAITSRFPKAMATVACAASLLLGLAPARPAVASPNTYYVSTTGSDADPGTLAAPFGTVAKGIRTLRAGDTLYVRGGLYSERIDTTPYQAGTPGAPIRVAAYPGERPVIKGLLAIRYADYWTFDGINVVWDPANSPDEVLVKIMNGIGWSFRNGEIWGARSYANLFIGGSDAGRPSNWSVVGNCIHDTLPAHPPFQDHNIYVGGASGAGPGLIERNILYNASNGENIKLGGASATDNPAGPVSVRNNTMYNASQNVLVAWRSHDILIERNLIGHSTGKSWYPNVRGFAVTGLGNVARNNVGFDAYSFLMNTDSTTGIVDGGANVFPRQPLYDSTSSCAAFHPNDPVARLYGRYGLSGIPVVGDWDRSGAEGPGLVRGNVWYVNDSFDSTAEHVLAYGKVGDSFVAGDWNGDGTATPGVVRGNNWYLNDGFDAGAEHVVSYGSLGDKPLVGDWNGDGTATPGVVRGNTWYLNDGFDASPEHVFQYGKATDTFVVGDWDGNGTYTPGVVRGNIWYLNDGFDPYPEHVIAFGKSTDTYVVGDWNGDGVTTPGVIRSSDWFLRDGNGDAAGVSAYSDQGW